MKYIICEQNSLSELIEIVNANLKRGWKTCGGVAVHHEHLDEDDREGHTVFFQALIFEEYSL